jgi:glycerophosphoryl diester phosphodiesterase
MVSGEVNNTGHAPLTGAVRCSTGGPGGAPMTRPLRLAHRGDWRSAPENSVDAMRAALAIPGCDGLEFDVRESQDGVPVLLHDETLERVQGVPASVDSLTAAELRDHGVPTLEEVLAAVGREPFLDVELKGAATPRVVKILEGARAGIDGNLHRAVVSSFEAWTLAWLQERRPRWRLWLNAEVLSPSQVTRARTAGCRGISAGWQSIDLRTASSVRDAGLELAAWTVRRRSTAARLEHLGVVAICVEAAALDD